MMKTFLLFFFLFFFSPSILSRPPRVLQILRLLSPECSYHGYLYKTKCFCQTGWSGVSCQTQVSIERSDDLSDYCDNFYSRLDNLYNISPDFYLFDDDEFPRINLNSIDGSNGTSGAPWTRMHDLTKNFHIFSDRISADDIGQGELKNCYLLAALASLANRKNGASIKEMFMTKEDNANHVYVTKWMINGKPRFVAVDDWIPGQGTGTRFTQLQKDLDAWPLILEKAYAKIYETYKKTEGGLQTDVWTGITAAPSFEQKHRLYGYNSTLLFNLLKSLFQKNYVVGADTGKNAKNEVVQHAFSVLGVYEITKETGEIVKLVRYFNPWHSDFWNANPWGDKSTNWTNFTKAQVPYSKGDDGFVFSTIDDYFLNFDWTSWAEIEDNYDVTYVDLGMNYNDSIMHDYQTQFIYNGSMTTPIHIFNDQSQKRDEKCEIPVFLSNFVVKTPNGEIYKSSRTRVKINDPVPGVYDVSFKASRNKYFARYLTITSYAPDNSVVFIPKAEDEIKYLKKTCPNNCNSQGRCNTLNGVCSCFFGYTGLDCFNIIQKTCTNCDQSACDPIFGVCVPNGLFNLAAQKYASINDSNNYVILTEKAKAHKWKITSQGLIQNENNGKYLEIPSGNLYSDYMSTWFLNKPLSKNQQWLKINSDATSFVLQTLVNKNYSLSVNLNKSILFAELTKKNDPRQIWSLLPLTVDCPNGCSKQGVCSITTGKCVCKTGYDGIDCSIVEPLMSCPKNCSGKGICNVETGLCSCNSGFLGDDCSTSYEDIICPGRCSNNGKCDLQIGCLCDPGFTGKFCNEFPRNILRSLKNGLKGTYLGVFTQKENYLFINTASLVANRTLFNLTSSGTIVRQNDGKVIDILRILDKIGENARLQFFSPKSGDQWIFEHVEKNGYLIKSQTNSDYALGIGRNGINLQLKLADKKSLEQIWYIE